MTTSKSSSPYKLDAASPLFSIAHSVFQKQSKVNHCVLVFSYLNGEYSAFVVVAIEWHKGRIHSALSE